MPDLVRLTYASMPTAHAAKVQGDLIDILHHSRHFNPKRQICGVLFYDNNYFFQCLEGEREQVFKLYHKIASDSRHTNIAQLSCEAIETPVFSRWQMKYILEDPRIRHFFAHHYAQKFNPYLLTDESALQLNQEFIQLLLTGQESPIADTTHFARPVPVFAAHDLTDSSKFFTLFVLIPIIVICLIIYLVNSL